MWHQQISVGLQKLNFTAATRLLVSNNVCMQLGSEQGMCKLWKASFPAAASPPAHYNSGGHPGYSGPATGSTGYGGPAGSKTNGGRYHQHYHHSKAPKSTCALFSTVSNVDMSTTPVMSYVSCHSCMKSYLNDPKARSLYWASLPLPVTTSKAVIIANAGGSTEAAADWLCRQFTSAFQTSSSILCPDDDVGGYGSPYRRFKVVGHRRSRVLLQSDEAVCKDRTDGMAVFLASQYNCTWYYSCLGEMLGLQVLMPCPPGLVFEQFALDEESGICNWPTPGDDCFQG
jgi:hypothetical protein